MASPQQEVFQRKIVYFVLIAVLFTVSFIWRRYVVEKQAERLALREEDVGEVEVVGSAVRLGLIGSRGLATCVLWSSAIEKQKKNQWNELEMLVRTLTKLQPHFITPWLFQSWNLAYNVSVESDRVRDKYFYVTRGVQLLYQGERQNRYVPDLRRDVGFYMQHKICQSDETNTMRSLFQLSCIPPHERDPDRFLVPGNPREVQWDVFAAFCQKYPQLARRLHSPPLPYDRRREYPKFRCRTALEMVKFLRDNGEVPTMYVTRRESESDWVSRKIKSDPGERFPVLPPARPNMFEAEKWPGRDEWTDEKVLGGVPDSFDAFTAARAWYGYAQECLPPPSKDNPGQTEPPQDRIRQRRPRHMATIIFRSSVPRAQSYVAERLAQEGWFDTTPFNLTGDGWTNPKFQGGKAIVLDPKVEWGVESWRRANEMWNNFAAFNRLSLPPHEEDNLKKLAERFAATVREGLDPTKFNPDAYPEPKRSQARAWAFLQDYQTSRHLANVQHFLDVSQMEMMPRTVTARRLFYEADRLRLAEGQETEALKRYEDPRALKAWREILDANKAFRDNASIQEDSYDIELKYLQLYQKERGPTLGRHLGLQAYFGSAVALSPLGSEWALLGLFARPSDEHLDVRGPFEGLIPVAVKNQVRTRRDLPPLGDDGSLPGPQDQPPPPPPGRGS